MPGSTDQLSGYYTFECVSPGRLQRVRDPHRLSNQSRPNCPKLHHSRPIDSSTLPKRGTVAGRPGGRGAGPKCNKGFAIKVESFEQGSVGSLVQRSSWPARQADCKRRAVHAPEDFPIENNRWISFAINSSEKWRGEIDT